MTETLSPEALQRALRYPYTIPTTHFRFDPETGKVVGSKHARLIDAEPLGYEGDARFYRLQLELDGERHLLPEVCPVVSAGSNSAPQQLHRKFHGIVHHPVYAIRCRISGWVPVYSAHFSGYGAIAGCLQEFPGAQSNLFVTLLTPAGLARMHETETLGVHYRFSRVPQAACALGDTALPLELFYYECLQGALLSADEAPLLLSAFDVALCPLPRLNQEQILRAAMADLFPDLALEAALARVVASTELRLSITARLKSLRIRIATNC